MALPARKRRVGVLLGFCALVGAAACSDALPTAPSTGPASNSTAAMSGTGGGSERAYLCYVSERTPGGTYKYRYGRRFLHIPQKMTAPDGRLTMYRLRLGGPGGELSGAANCLIPATWEAVSHANRLFGVREQFAQPMSTPFVLEELVVTACPPGTTGAYPDCKPNTSDSGGGPSGTSAGEPGSSGGGDDPDPGDPEDEEEEPIGCWPLTTGCLKPLTTQDTATLRIAISRVKTQFSDSAAAQICNTLKMRWHEALAQGKVFRGDTTISDGSMPHAGTTYWGKIHIDGEYLTRAADATNPQYEYHLRILAQIALHEAAHWAGYPNHGDSETWGSYSTFPYNYVNGGPGASELCV